MRPKSANFMAWENSWQIAMPLQVSREIGCLGKQAQKFQTNGAFSWWCRERSLLQPIRSITQIWVVNVILQSFLRHRLFTIFVEKPVSPRFRQMVRKIQDWLIARTSSFYCKTTAKALNWYQRNGTRFLFGIFRPEKQDYLFRCTLAPGNFPLERPKKSCSIPDFPESFCKW